MHADNLARSQRLPLTSLSTSLSKRLARFIPEPARIAIRNALFRWQNRGFAPYVGEQEHRGRRFKFYVGDRVGEQWLRDGWDWVEIDFLLDRVAEPGDRVLEAGAHHGEMMLLLAERIGQSGEMVSFEPVPLNADIVRANIALNGLEDRVTLVEKAVGAATGRARITDESNAQIIGGAEGGVDVDVTSLDDHADFRPTLLKIDVEGFEAEVLKGAQSILRSTPKLHIEVHPNPLRRFGSSLDEVLSLIGADRYDLWLHMKGASTVVPFEGQHLETDAHLFALPRPA